MFKFCTYDLCLSLNRSTLRKNQLSRSRSFVKPGQIFHNTSNCTSISNNWRFSWAVSVFSFHVIHFLPSNARFSHSKDITYITFPRVWWSLVLSASIVLSGRILPRQSFGPLSTISRLRRRICLNGFNMRKVRR